MALAVLLGEAWESPTFNATLDPVVTGLAEGVELVAQPCFRQVGPVLVPVTVPLAWSAMSRFWSCVLIDLPAESALLAESIFEGGSVPWWERCHVRNPQIP